jgi:hypothetical protein
LLTTSQYLDVAKNEKRWENFKSKPIPWDKCEGIEFEEEEEPNSTPCHLVLQHEIHVERAPYFPKT